jgi:senataxin
LLHSTLSANSSNSASAAVTTSTDSASSSSSSNSTSSSSSSSSTSSSSSSSSTTTSTRPERRILVCAPSNAAIDEVILRLLQRGVLTDTADNRRRRINIVRLGESPNSTSSSTSNTNPSTSISSVVLDVQVENKVRQDPAYVHLLKLRDAVTECEDQIASFQYTNNTTTTSSSSSSSSSSADGSATSNSKKLQSYRQTLIDLRCQRARAETIVDQLRATIRRQILLQAHIICTTLSSSNKQQFIDYIVEEQIVFHTVIVDEAAQTTEISTLIPLRLGCRHLILIGKNILVPSVYI